MMNYSIVRALVCSALANCIAVGSASAQSADSPQKLQEAPAGLWYSYDGPANWTLDGQGRPISSSRANSSTTSNKVAPLRWSAPVVPARPRVNSVLDGCHPEESAERSQMEVVLAPQRTTHADTYRPPIAEETVSDGAEEDGPEPSWTETAVEKFNSTRQAVVGGWNWLSIEANESFGVTGNRPERRRARPMCPGCGRRHFQRRD